MKTFSLSLMFVVLFSACCFAQDCNNGQCSWQQEAPVAAFVGNTTEAVVRVATAPIRYVATHKPVRRFAARVRSCTRRVGCCR